MAFGMLALGTLEPAHAARNLEIGADLSGRVSYIDVVTNDPLAKDVEDIQTTEGIATQFDLDNAYLHFDVRYQLVAGQLSHNGELNYVEHNVVLNLDLQRWLSRHSESGKMEVTLAVDTSPSLPSLQQDPLGSSDTPLGAQEGPGDQRVINANQSGQDLLNLRRDRSGYGLRYGLSYRDRAGPLGHYKLSWLVRDSRYKGGVVADQATLDVTAGYSQSLLRGEAGLTFGHKRFVRGGNAKERTVSLSSFYSQRHYLNSWGGSLGADYRIDTQATTAHGGLHASRSGGKVETSGRYSTELLVNEVGNGSLSRRHSLNLKVGSARQVAGAVSLLANGSLADDVKRSEVGLNQIIFPGGKSGIYAEIGFKWASLWWDDPATGKSLKSRSNVIGFNFIWRFL